MKTGEIRKWKRSALAAITRGVREASFSSAAAQWEIALQLAILNERESGVRRIDARAVYGIVQEVAAVAHQNQKMLRRLILFKK